MQWTLGVIKFDFHCLAARSQCPWPDISQSTMHHISEIRPAHGSPNQGEIPIHTLHNHNTEAFVISADDNFIINAIIDETEIRNTIPMFNN